MSDSIFVKISVEVNNGKFKIIPFKEGSVTYTQDELNKKPNMQGGTKSNTRPKKKRRRTKRNI